MTFTVTQKLLSFGPQYSVCDENSQERYHVEGELLSFGRQLRMYDASHREVAFIKQKWPSMLPSFSVLVGGREIACIKAELALFSAKYSVTGLGWAVEGNILRRHYRVKDAQGRQIAQIDKEWTLLQDTFTLHLDDHADEITAIAVVLAIDTVLDMQNNAVN